MMWLREAGWTEERAQAEIAANPGLIGVSRSWRVQQERPHGGGRPDIFFASPEGTEICVVELQLRGVDHYHIAKTAEFLARERVAAPAANCRCILVAESFAGRYGRLAEALARVGPIELFTMTVDETTASTLVIAPHHLPALSLIPEEDATRESRWRTRPWFSTAEGLLEQIMDVDPAWSPKFNAQYIGGQRFGGDWNSIAIREKSPGFQIEVKIERSNQADEILNRSRLPFHYRSDREHTGTHRRHYRVSVPPDCCHQDLAPLRELVIQAHHRWGKIQG